jgi:hypothetical protein
MTFERIKESEKLIILGTSLLEFKTVYPSGQERYIDHHLFMSFSLRECECNVLTDVLSQSKLEQIFQTYVLSPSWNR